MSTQHYRKLRTILFSMLVLVLVTQVGFTSASTAPMLDTTNTTVTSGWIDAKESAGIIYILYPTRIMRYDMHARNWLADIPLDAAPTAFVMDEQSIFVAFGTVLERMDLDGANRVNLYTAPQSIDTLLQWKSYVYAASGESLTSLAKTNGQVLASRSWTYVSFKGAAIAPNGYGIYPTGMAMMLLQANSNNQLKISGLFLHSDGTWGTITDGSFLGKSGDASKLWFFPWEGVAVDKAGAIYGMPVMNPLLTLVNRVDDIVFDAGLPVILSGGSLVRYNAQLLESARVDPFITPKRIFIYNRIIYAMHEENGSPAFSFIPVDSIIPPEPGLPMDQTGISYLPDTIMLGSDGVVYLTSRDYPHVFRWKVADRQYLPSIPLARAPKYAAYSPVLNRLYLAYHHLPVTQISLVGPLNETPFATLPHPSCGIEPAGQALYTCTLGWNTERHFTYQQDGTQFDQVSMPETYRYFSWSQANERLYAQQVSPSPNGLVSLPIDSLGDIGFMSWVSAGNPMPPIRIKDDGSVGVTGSGGLFNAKNFTYLGNLPNVIQDALWQSDTLYTLAGAGPASAWIQKWNPDNTLQKSVEIVGAPLRIFSTGHGLLAITQAAGRPRFTLWDFDLNVLYQTPLADFSATPPGGVAPVEIQFANLSSEGPIESILWDFGDQATSTLDAPLHTYASAGDYTVTLTVTGPGGQDTARKHVLVTQQTFLPLVEK